MAGKSPIEWTEHTWNPIVGCSIVSPGCTNCYAMKMAARIDKMTLSSHYEGITKKVNGSVVWTGKLALANDYIFTAPLRRKKPTTYFVNSMGDLFHEDAPDEWIDRVFAIMALAPQHTFQVLTKRAERMREYFLARHPSQIRAWQARVSGAIDEIIPERTAVSWKAKCDVVHRAPLPNVWLGVSAERQKEWDERKEHLRNTPAAVHFASFEPLLGAIVEPRPMSEFIQWAIVGGESGSGARPMHPDWPRSLRDQCAAANVPLFFKQWGSWYPTIDRDNDDPDWRRDYTVISRHPEKFRTVDLAGGFSFHGERVHLVQRYSKKAAGRLLDGKEHNEFPGSLPSALAATQNKPAQVQP